MMFVIRYDNMDDEIEIMLRREVKMCTKALGSYGLYFKWFFYIWHSEPIPMNALLCMDGD
jgi:hypothetical protein